MKIEAAMSEIINAMRERGSSEGTIQRVKWCYFPCIRRIHEENNETNVSRKLLTELCKKYHLRYENGEISRKFYRTVVAYSHRLITLDETGTIDFSRVVDRRKFIPNDGNLLLIECIKESTETTAKRLGKIDIILRRFFCFLEEKEKSLMELETSDYIEFINLAAKTNSNNMNIVIFSLKAINKYLNDNDILKISIDFSNFTPKNPPKKIIAPYSQEEINAVIDAIPPESKTFRRDRAIILLAFNTGLRGVDIRNLRLTDINWSKYEIELVQSKNGKSIIVPVNGKTLNAVADYILHERYRGKDNHVFLKAVSPYDEIKTTAPLDFMMDKYCKKAGIEKRNYRSFHSLRRAFGTELATAEVPVTSISQMLGHADLSSDKAYLSFNKSQTSLCAADFSEVPISKGIYSFLIRKGG